MSQPLSMADGIAKFGQTTALSGFVTDQVFHFGWGATNLLVVVGGLSAIYTISRTWKGEQELQSELELDVES